MKIPCKGMYIRVCDGSGTSLKQTPDHPCDTHYLFGGYHAKIIDKSIVTLFAVAIVTLVALLFAVFLPADSTRAGAAGTRTVSTARDLAIAMVSAEEGDTVQLSADITFDLTDSGFVSGLYPVRRSTAICILRMTDLWPRTIRRLTLTATRSRSKRGMRSAAYKYPEWI